MLDTFRNLLRKKLRTALTVSGVLVGVFSFIVIGSLAEHFNILAGNFRKNFSERIFVCEKVTFWAGGGILPEEKAEEVEKVSGVISVIPNLIARFNARSISLINLPEIIVGISPEKLGFLSSSDFLYRGEFSIQESSSVLLGYDIARSLQAEPGKSVNIRNHPFIVKGILKKTGAIEDKQAVISLEDAQAILNRPGLITSIIVTGDPSENYEVLADRIRSYVSGVEVVTPADLSEQVDQNLSLWNLLIFGTMLLAGITSTLCIIISMVVTVNDRLPEIGLKKAIGATKLQIIKEYILEAAAISVSGWVFGFLLGILFVFSFAKFLAAGGIDLFSITFRLILISFAWSICLGILGGLYPAVYAAELNPVLAMKR